MRKSFIFLLIVLLIAPAIYPFPAVGVAFNGNECYRPIRNQALLEIHYTHSVSLTKVVDVYRVSGDGIYFTMEMWQEFLAGQPIDFDYRDGDFYVKREDRFLGKHWEYWFIPLNNVTVVMDGIPMFVQPPQEGVLRIEVTAVPGIILTIRRC
ncbi:DUF1850 domain-containing protein [Thermococcus thioreducens]|uniref:DUF1850 domain-containing protein n=1 Tax=Thermococcus thioreducens TaxID=277988 RepID=A0A1I0P5N4_9EURY|nr:DUF1850 domain-containing protein [Thermococcus thioreducens]ASJ12032.1 hypothetical protein A3L14_03655 [Thermococcus thioreducens]SEW09681.1 protein of unknown function [Thermococcus thioreducens]